MHKIMISIIIIRILEKHTMYQRTLCSFWKNLSGHFSRSPLKRSLNRSDGYASAGDRKNWLAEISPEFCIPMKHSGLPDQLDGLICWLNKSVQLFGIRTSAVCLKIFI